MDAAVILDFLDEVLGHRVFGPMIQGGQDFIAADAGSGGVPQAQGGDAIGMDMLRALFKLRKARNRVARLFKNWIIHFYQEGVIALYYYRFCHFWFLKRLRYKFPNRDFVNNKKVILAPVQSVLL